MIFRDLIPAVVLAMVAVPGMATGCMEGMIKNAKTGDCEFCPDGSMRQFTDGPDSCRSCSNGFVPNLTKSRCVPQYDSKKCFSDHDYCKTDSDCCVGTTCRYEGVWKANLCLITSACPAGSTGIGPDSPNGCSKCAAGTAKARTGNHQCVPCGNNMISGEGSATCTACATGTFASADHTECVDSCMAGTFKSAVTGDCEKCAAGTKRQFTDGVDSACVSCTNGFVPNLTQSRCVPPPKQCFSDHDYCKTDSDCCVGTTCRYEGVWKANLCLITSACPAGSIGLGPNSPEGCSKCPAGTAKARTGNHQCVPCAANTISSEGAATCTACPAGTSTNADATKCVSPDAPPTPMPVAPRTPPPAPSCSTRGRSCADGETCCDALTCQTTATGKAVCRPPLPTCTSRGQSCEGGNACCDDLACTKLASGRSVCRPAPTCLPRGQSCASGIACCDDLTCATLSSGAQVCRPPLPTCTSRGQSCEGGDACCDDLTCTKLASGRSVCRPAPSCMARGQSCAGAIACCDDLTCATLNSGAQVCRPTPPAPTCGSRGVSCADGLPCCDDLSCTKIRTGAEVCRPTPPPALRTPAPKPATPVPAPVPAPVPEVCMEGMINNAKTGDCEFCPDGSMRQFTDGPDSCRTCSNGFVPNLTKSRCVPQYDSEQCFSDHDYCKTDSDCCVGTTCRYEGVWKTNLCINTSACPAGSTGIGPDSPNGCSKCAAGTAKARNGNHQCVPCGNNMISGEGSTTCTACPAGTFADAEHKECVEICMEGTFKDAVTGDCEKCAEGTMRRRTDGHDASCRVCTDGFVPNLTRSRCVAAYDPTKCFSDHDYCKTTSDCCAGTTCRYESVWKANMCLT